MPRTPAKPPWRKHPVLFALWSLWHIPMIVWWFVSGFVAGVAEELENLKQRHRIAPHCGRKDYPMSLAQPSETLTKAIEAASDNARAKAEIAIEKVLRDLEHDTMLKIDQVQVDTRNFANLNVEIFFQDKQ